MNCSLIKALLGVLLSIKCIAANPGLLEKLESVWHEYWEIEKLMSLYNICQDIAEPNILSRFFEHVYPKGREWVSDQYEKCSGNLRDLVHRSLDLGYIKLVDKCRFGFGTFQAWHFYRTVYRYLPCDEGKIKPEHVIPFPFQWTTVQ